MTLYLEGQRVTAKLIRHKLKSKIKSQAMDMFEYFKATCRTMMRSERCKAAHKFLSSMDFESRLIEDSWNVQVQVTNLHGDKVWMHLSEAQIKCFSDHYFFKD